MTLTLELLALLALLVLNGFFVAAEYGLVTARRTRIMELEHQGNRRARLVLRITSDPPRFISAMQLGVTVTSLAIGAVGEPLFAELFDPLMATALAVILALLVITYMHVVIGELVPKGIALGNPDRTALAVSPFVRAFFVALRPADLAPRALDRARPARVRPRSAGRGAGGALGGRAAHAPLLVRRAGRDRGGRAGDALQGLRLRGQGGRGRDGPAAGGGGDLDRAARGGGPPGGPRLAVHALPGLPRLGRRHRGRAPHPRPDRGALRARDRIGLARRPRPPGVHGSRDEGPRRAPDRVPAHEPAPRDRDQRVRRDGGDRDARRRARGDRRRDRGRVRPSGRDRRARRRRRRSGSTGRSRSTTSTRSSRSTSRRRTTTRSPASSSASSGAPPRRGTRSPTTGSPSTSTRSRGSASTA